jgi:double-strand break repair protein MRE11
LGDRSIDFEFLSDQNQNFPDSFLHTVNYEDNNLNVSIPVFSIHGNHDDITGSDRLSCMDILSSTGLINYFGKWQDLSKVEITPLVIQKNETRIALYGLSHIHDVRLARLFRDKLVKLNKPNIPDSDIFSMMVLHQNRADRGRYNFLPEEQLPDFMDFVLWGHEHDCRIEPEFNPKNEVYICQPGSSVATSLAEGESIEKKIGILEIHKKCFKLNPISLKTVRPFVFRSVNIEEYVDRLKLNEGNVKDKIMKFYNENVNEMIEEAMLKITGHKKQPQLPLIRLRIEHTNEDYSINTVRFGQKFDKIIANPESVLAFKRISQKRTKVENYNPDDVAMKSAFAKKEQQDCVEDVVENYFTEAKQDDKLKTFNLKSLTEVCRLLVRGDDVAVKNILFKHEEMAKDFLKEKACSQDEILDNLLTFQGTKSLKALDHAHDNIAAPVAQSSTKNAFDMLNSTSTSNRGKISTTRGRGATTSRTSRAKQVPDSNPTQDNTDKRSTQRSVRVKSTKTLYIDDSD